MKRVGLLAVCWLWVSPVLPAAQLFQIPYLPANGWTTTITAYNDADRTAFVNLRQWNEYGRRILEKSAPVPAHGRLVWTQEEFYADRLTAISTDEDRVRVKLSCQYLPTRALGEVFLGTDGGDTQWLIPNSHPDPGASLSIAVANFGRQAANLSLTAYKDGVWLKSARLLLRAGRQRLLSNAELWDLPIGGIDMVLVTSDQPLCAPLAISATGDRVRQRILAGNPIEHTPGEKRFFVPHIPGDPWKTELVLYNAGADAATFSVHQYDDAGAEVGVTPGKAPPWSAVVLESGAQGKLAAAGSALITGRGDLAVKVSYRFHDASPAAEFFAGSDISRRWFLTNPMQVGFDWYGIAVQNPGAVAAHIVFRAYKDGLEVANFAASVGARGKIASFSEQVFHLRHWEFDMVSLESSQPVPMPLAITADARQENHLFYEGQASADAIQPRKWTILFYNDADFANAFNPTRDFALEAWSGPNVDVLVLEDTAQGPTNLYYVNPNRSLARIDSPKEKNMGDPQTLYDFLMKAKTEFPAERYILAIYDHGFGWQGCCIDQTSADYLTMEEMRQALSRAGGVDLTLFTAPCFMAELESVYEVRDWTDVYIGSEDLSTYMWFGTIQSIRSTLAEQPDISSADLAGKIVASIVNHIPANQALSSFPFVETYTISAVDTRGVGALAADLDALALAWLARPDEMRERISSLWSEVQNYSDYFSVDLYDLVGRYAALEASAEIRSLIRKVQESLKACILAEAHGPASMGSHGLSIYFPAAPDAVVQQLYADPAFGLDFSAATNWPAVIKTYKNKAPE